MSRNNDNTYHDASRWPVFALLHHWGAMPRPWPLWLMAVLLISPAAFWIPADVFLQYPWTGSYAKWLAQFIPMIDRAAHLNPHPDHFRAFYAYAWSCFPVCLLLAYFDGREKMLSELVKKIHLPISFFAVLLPVLTGALLIIAPGDKVFDWSLITRNDARAFLYRSEFSLMWFGPLQSYVVAIIVMLSVRYLRIAIANLPTIETPTSDRAFDHKTKDE